MSAFQYRPAIDGFRAVAVLAVFFFHLNARWLPGGFLGVDIFFVISGYLITSIIVKDCEVGEFSLLKFYQRRVARIFPAFFAVAVATLFAAWFIYTPQDFASSGANFSAAVLSLANIKLMLQGNYFEISPDAQPFLHYWSLSVEEQFYLLFPLFLLLLYRFSVERRHFVLGSLGIGSLLGCVYLTRSHPGWAFYLLPTRAWELLAGCFLASVTNDGRIPDRWKLNHPAFSLCGLVMLLASLCFVHEGRDFPGFWPLLPVAGAVAVIYPQGSRFGYCEGFLSYAPLVLIGRMSYSLYLWHWPVFSLVDYRLLLYSEPVRLAAKVGISVVLAFLSFRYLESPARGFLNQRKNRSIAYGVLMVALVVCVPLGIAVRKAGYVNAEFRDVAKGGLVFPGKPGSASVVLMGDSNGSMYGRVLGEICAELGLKLTVISVAAGDPLPVGSSHQGKLWLDTLAVVEREKPEYLIVACHWVARLRDDKNRLAMALADLQRHAGTVVILNQPPILPASASRANIRSGVRPPFVEDPVTKQERNEANALLLGLASKGVKILPISDSFDLPGGEIRFFDGHGRQLYQDETHLSGYGAELVGPLIRAALHKP